MEQKTKFMLFGLVGAIVICIVFIAQLSKSRLDLVRERSELMKDRVTLENQMSSLRDSVRSYETKITSLNSDLKKSAQEIDDLKSKNDLLKSANDELMERMKEAKTSAPAKSAPSSSVSQASDEYWAAVLQSKADLEMQLGNVRNELKTTLLNNEQMEKEKEALDLELKSLKRETEDVRRQIEYDKKMADRQMDYERKKMEQQLADNKRIMDRLSQDLVTEKNDKMKIQEMLNTLKSENRALTHEIENLSSRKVDLEERLKQVQDDKVMVERKFREMETVLADNISKVNELKTKLESGPRSTATEAQKLAAPASRKQAVELPPIVVRPQATVGVGAAAPGRHILAVNKEGNFVIIDLGEDAGVKMGDTFTVYRDGKKIALLEAIRVSKTVTACDIKKQVLPITTADTFK